MKKKRDWGKWERGLREHRATGQITAFILDEVNPKRPKYELVRFSAPLALLALSIGGTLLAPGALTII